MVGFDYKEQYISKYHKMTDTFFVSRTIDVLGEREIVGVDRWNKKLLPNLFVPPTVSHFTLAMYPHMAGTHASDNIACLKGIAVDKDFPEGTPEVAKQEYLDKVDRQVRQLGLNIYSIVATPHGYHIVFVFRFPAWHYEPNHFKMASELKSRLIRLLDADGNQPLLNMLTAIPDGIDDIVYCNDATWTEKTITLTDALKATKTLIRPRQATQDRRAVPAVLTNPANELFEKGSRNNTTYTIALLCKGYRKPMSFALDLINRLAGVKYREQDEINLTVASAYKHSKHATNERVQAYCLGTSVRDASQRLGIHTRRTLTDAELIQARRQTLQSANDAKSRTAIEKIRIAEQQLIDAGERPSLRKIERKSGISRHTLIKYRHIAWNLH